MNFQNVSPTPLPALYATLEVKIMVEVKDMVEVMMMVAGGEDDSGGAAQRSKTFYW